MIRAVMNGQSALKSELIDRINKVDIRVGKLDRKIDGVEKRLTKRIDKIGSQVAFLEEDAPTREEFDELGRRIVQNLNDNLSSNNHIEPNSTFSESFKIPFEFTIPMPPPRYYPMILERDKKGRILKSEFPPISYK